MPSKRPARRAPMPPRKAPAAAVHPTPDATVAALEVLARAGQHAAIVAQAGAALADAGAMTDQRIALLDLRAESLSALGHAEAAQADVDAMLALARRNAGYRARALLRKSALAIRMGRPADARDHAQAARPAALRSGNPSLIAWAHLRLAIALGRLRQSPAALDSAWQAARVASEAGLTLEEGRAFAAAAGALYQISKPKEVAAAGLRAARLARQCGDFQGLGHALNAVAIVEPDLAARLRLQRESEAAYRAAGDLNGLATI